MELMQTVCGPRTVWRGGAVIWHSSIIWRRAVISWAFVGACLVGVALPASGYADSTSFEPVWRMLTREQKQQFVAGYLSGMRDAAKMTELLQELMKERAGGSGKESGGGGLAASGSLDRLTQIYDEIGRASPDVIAQGIDSFYEDPQNQGAQLSAAVTSAQSRRAAALAKEQRP